SVPCSTCHGGAYVSQGTSGAQAKIAGHVATTAECSTCHKSTTTWAGATFAHAATDTNCASCHNGTTATGMATPPHIPTGTVQCSSCHTNTATSFTTYTMNHAAVDRKSVVKGQKGGVGGRGTSEEQNNEADHAPPGMEG